MRTRATGGVGSNQYQTRGAPNLDRGERAAVAAALTVPDEEDGGTDDTNQSKASPALPTQTLAIRMLGSLGRAASYRTSERLTEDEEAELVAGAVHIARMVRDAGIDIDGLDPEGPEAIGWAFANPDWASAGFGINDEVETRLWQKSPGGANIDPIEAARAAREDGFTWFDGNLPPRAWVDRGWTRPAEAEAWRSSGVTVDEAVEWLEHGFGRDEAMPWRNQQFTPADAEAWREALRAGGKPAFHDLRNASTASTWRDRGIPVEEVAGWLHAGFNAAQADKARREGRSYQTESNRGPHGIPGQSWKTLLNAATTQGVGIEEPVPSNPGWSMLVRDHRGLAIGTVFFDSDGKFDRAEHARNPSWTYRRTLRDLPEVLKLWADDA